MREQAKFNVNHPNKGNLATEECGKYEANLFGLYDMHGNVQEWCSDWYVENYYEGSPAVDPPGPNAGTQRAVRGGCWTFQAKDCRSAYRSRAIPSKKDSKIGFRVVAEQRV